MLLLKRGGGRGARAHPEQLFGEKVWVAGVCPETAGAKAAGGVVLGPGEARAGPVFVWGVFTVFPGVVGELLVVCDGLVDDECEGCQEEGGVCLG